MMKYKNTYFDKIARIAAFYDGQFGDTDRADLILDMVATHRARPLDLDAMLANLAGFDVMHDVVGILNNLDRKSKTLKNGFLPRYTLKG